MDLKDLRVKYDLGKAYFELDALQEEMLKFYVRADPKFKRAFFTDYTEQFFQYLNDKARLLEVAHLSVMGNTRSGKSYSAMSLAFIMNLLHGRIMDMRYVCANQFDYLEAIKAMPMEDLKNSCFLIDEDKGGVFGTGSIAKKTKLLDVQNIIAKQNISTISLTPHKFANENANYGLRTMGRDFKQKINRFMLYNLQEGDRGGSKPMGMCYIPIFTKLLPKEISDKLEKEYEEKKDEWIEKEQRGEGDVLYKIKKNSAKVFADDEKFLGLSKKDEKLAYIGVKLGSEWTRTEINEIYNLANLYIQGALNE